MHRDYGSDEDLNSKIKVRFDIDLIRKLMSYTRPFLFLLAVSFFFLLVLTGLQLVRPVLIGNAIDLFINGYKKPFIQNEVISRDTIIFRGLNLTVESGKEETGNLRALILYYDNDYFFFKDIDRDRVNLFDKIGKGSCKREGDSLFVNDVNKRYVGIVLSESDLKILRFHDFKGIILITALFLLLLILSFVFSYLQTLILQFTGQRIIFTMRRDIFEHILNLPFKFFDTNPVGTLVTRVTNDTEAINEMYTNVLVNFLKNIFIMAGIVVMMLFINPFMTLITVSIIPFICMAVVIFRHYARRNYRNMRRIIGKMNGFLSENISGMKIIQIFNIERKKAKEFDSINRELKDSYMSEIRIFSFFRPLMFIFYILTTVLIIISGGNEVIKGGLSFGTLFIFLYYVRLFFEPVQELAEQFNILQQAMASSERIFKLLDTKNDIINKKDAVKIENIRGRIEFRNVWFAYNDEDWVLRDVSFTIEPGETVAIAGFTGSGKTTIIALLSRYYEIQRGTILIDDIDIRDIHIGSLRREIGIVMQDVFLFTGNIASNIGLDDPHIGENDIREASKFVNAHSFIEKFKMGYDEEVTERGLTLSSGQRQLLSFARTIAFNPSVLALDEATSNIDTETESLIQSALDKVIKGRTSIIIAHRLSTIKHADKILVLQKGELRESGSHEELLAKKGIYYNLYLLNYGIRSE